MIFKNTLILSRSGKQSKYVINDFFDSNKYSIENKNIILSQACAEKCIYEDIKRDTFRCLLCQYWRAQCDNVA